MKSIYIVDPYYSDSHRYWAEALSQNLEAKTRIFYKPPIHWKWRMEGAAIQLAKDVVQTKTIPDTFLVTDFLNLALFKSLLTPQYRESQFVLYMHENQLTYPISTKDTDRIHNRDNHYGFMNYTSCLVADKIIFNSQFHLRSFIQGLKNLSNILPDRLDIQTIQNKSIVIPLFLDTTNFKPKTPKDRTDTKTILWNHRWEYDKRPDIFLNTLIDLSNSGTSFHLVLLGKTNPTVMENHRGHFQKLKDHIVHNGYVDTKAGYYDLISSSDIIVSTSIHDFFGLSVLEGIYGGCRPLLPNDLAYPELVPQAYYNEIFYTRKHLNTALKECISDAWPIHKQTDLKNFIDNNFTWDQIKDMYCNALNLD